MAAPGVPSQLVEVVFSVPKQPKKDEEAGRAASNTGHRTSNKMPRIRRRGSVVTPRDRNTGKQRHRAHVPDSTPRSLGSLQLEHHLINKEEAHLTKSDPFLCSRTLFVLQTS